MRPDRKPKLLPTRAFPRDVMANGTNPLLLIDELRMLGTVTVTALTEDVPRLDEIDQILADVDMLSSGPQRVP